MLDGHASMGRTIKRKQAMKGTIKHLTRMKNTRMGNPCWLIVFETETETLLVETAPNVAFSTEIHEGWLGEACELHCMKKPVRSGGFKLQAINGQLMGAEQ